MTGLYFGILIAQSTKIKVPEQLKDSLGVMLEIFSDSTDASGTHKLDDFF